MCVCQKILTLRIPCVFCLFLVGSSCCCCCLCWLLIVVLDVLVCFLLAGSCCCCLVVSSRSGAPTHNRLRSLVDSGKGTFVPFHDGISTLALVDCLCVCIVARHGIRVSSSQGPSFLERGLANLRVLVAVFRRRHMAFLFLPSWFGSRPLRDDPALRPKSEI